MPASLAAKKAAERRHEQRQTMFPHVPDDEVWTRLKNKGWTTIPRPWPSIAQVMDRLSKDKPISQVFLDLWCCGWDSPFVDVSNERERAFACGWGGQRGAEVWRERVRILERLGFLYTKSGAKGTFQHILIVNPYLAIARHCVARRAGLDETTISALLERCIEYGSDEFKSLLAALKAGKRSATPVEPQSILTALADKPHAPSTAKVVKVGRRKAP
ncbi:MAG TPA: hypothetical protein VEL07_09325 [Planctomycetota bacterium]|nr:hypothetical protein [Planctomycetota bacterium]